MSDPTYDDRPWLVSFPRTGSNWLRVALDDYYGGHPLIHTHSTDLAKGREEVVYLFRQDATAVVYSLLQYRNAEPTQRLVLRTAREYADHLRYWLKYERAKLVVTYEEMQHDLYEVVARIARFCELPPPNGFTPELYDYERVQAHVSDERPTVRLDRESYERGRERFRWEYEAMIVVTMRGSGAW